MFEFEPKVVEEKQFFEKFSFDKFIKRKKQLRNIRNITKYMQNARPTTIAPDEHSANSNCNTNEHLATSNCNTV